MNEYFNLTMEDSRPYYLIDKLISNKLSKDELDELLSKIGEKEMAVEYSVILEGYFNELLNENSKKNLFEN